MIVNVPHVVDAMPAVSVPVEIIVCFGGDESRDRSSISERRPMWESIDVGRCRRRTGRHVMICEKGIGE